MATTPDYATISKNILDSLNQLYTQVNSGLNTTYGTGGMSNPLQNTTSLSSQLNTAQQSINTLQSTTLSADNEAAWLDAANATSNSLQDALLQLGNTSISTTATQIANNLNQELTDAKNALKPGLTATAVALAFGLGLYVAWKVL